MQINEKIFIQLYNDGKTDLELAKLFSTSERSIQRYGAKLRLAGKIKPRKDLPSSKTVSVEPTYTRNIEPVDWKIKKTTRKSSNKKTPFTTYLAIADTHVPYENEPAVKSVLQLMDDVKFDGFLIVGDYMDMTPISHWLKNKRKTLENKRMKDDYIAGNKLLDEFDKRLPKGCDKRFWYGNHECLSQDTELLTNRGWINYSEILSSDSVLSFNPKTEIGEWVKIDKIITKSFDGFLNRINTRKMDLLATDNHKLFAKNKGGTKYNYIEIKDMKKQNYLVPVTCSLGGHQMPFPINDDMLKLIAWVLTDGWITKKGYVRICQKPGIKADKIIKLLNSLKLTHTATTRNRIIIEICGVKLKNPFTQSIEFKLTSKASKEVLKFLNKEKNIPNYIKDLSDKQFITFMDTLIDGDGSRRWDYPVTSLMLYGKKAFLEQVQTLCLTHNYSTSLSAYRKSQYRLNISKRPFLNFYNDNKITKEYYRGQVWDLTVKNHNFMVKRNGKCFFTGNCWSDQFIEEYPVLEGLLDPITSLKLEERGYKIYEKLNHIERIGKLNITHGMYHSMHYVKTHIDKLKTNVLFGHLHSPRQRFESSPAREIAIAGYALGCLCDLAPDFMKNRANAWVHGFAVIYFYDNGYFDVDIKRIVKGRFIYNGKIYNGNI